MSRVFVHHYLRLTGGNERGTGPGPVINTVVIDTRKEVVNRNCRMEYNRKRTRIGTFTSIGPRSRRLLDRTAVCIDLRPYSRCNGAPPYTSLVMEGNMEEYIYNYISPFTGIRKHKVRGVHRTNVRMAINILRTRYLRLGGHFVAFGARRQPCVVLG